LGGGNDIIFKGNGFYATGYTDKRGKKLKNSSDVGKSCNKKIRHKVLRYEVIEIFPAKQ